MKYFSDSYLNQYDILKNSKIGLEFEFFSKLSYGNTLEILNRNLDKKVHGFKEYHPSFEPNENEWMITPDFSGGINMIELITHPMSYAEARITLIKVYQIIKELGYTTERTGVHINISFDNNFLDIQQINPIKLVLGISEEYIYSFFPDRKGNIYCKSIKNIIPFKDYDFSHATTNIMTSSLFLHSSISKYFGVNFTCLNQGRLEFRYIGGEDYEDKSEESLELLDYFVNLCYESIKNKITDNENKMLRDFLEKNIEKYKKLSVYENFLSKYPSVSLEIDKRSEYEIVKSYYPNFYKILYDFLSQTKNLENCKINFDTDTRKIEIVNANIIINGFITDVFFINCNIEGGDFFNVEFYNTQIEKSIINQSLFQSGSIDDSKILESKVIKNTIITNSYFADGYLDCIMKSGIFRSGKIGENSDIAEEVKMLNKDENFFNIQPSNMDIDNIFTKKK